MIDDFVSRRSLGVEPGLEDWGQMLSEGGGDPLDPSFEFSQDPVLGLPRAPYQAAQVDPAQDPFQFPFQYPSQDPSQDQSQYSPVDLPENELQQTFDPFAAFSDLNNDDASDWSQRFDPHNSLVANAYEIGRAMAEEQGFDLGVFGQLNLGDSLLGNAWNINKQMEASPETAWDWAGDFPQLFDDIGSAIGEAVSNLMPDFAVPDMMTGGLEAPISEATGTGTDMAALTEFADQIVKGPAAAAGAEAGSPVVTQVAEASEVGIDLTSAAVVSGAAVELTAADVLPSVGELIAAVGL